jgi:DNA-binding response OmpR family regulator
MPPAEQDNLSTMNPPVLTSAGCRARILLVEHDPGVRQLWRTVLERDGHTVSGLRSLDLLGESGLLDNGPRVDLVVVEGLALTSGADLRALRQNLPARSTLLVAGLCQFDWDLTGTPNTLLWPKPFALEDLRRLARTAARGDRDQAPVAIICDDCPHTRELLSLVAQDAGYETVATSLGSEVLDLVEVCQAKVVLLDILMPEQDGLVTLRQIRAARLPVQVITLSGGPELYLHVAEQLGADHIMTKPVALQTLRGLLREIAGLPGVPVAVAAHSASEDP